MRGRISLADEVETTRHRRHPPFRTRLEPGEWRTMFTQLNVDLKSVRSSVGTRERKRLDIIENELRGNGTERARYPSYLQLVERNADRLYIGAQEISYDELIDRARIDAFKVIYFDFAELESEVEEFLQSHSLQCAPPAGSPAVDPDRTLLSISQWAVRSLSRIYKRIFGLEPYIGGVGASQNNREPHSPFGTFAKFVLDSSEIKTRNGSGYSMRTIKNCFGTSDIKEARLTNEPELVAARRELEIEQLLVKKRGRPPKAKSGVT